MLLRRCQRKRTHRNKPKHHEQKEIGQSAASKGKYDTSFSIQMSRRALRLRVQPELGKVTTRFFTLPSDDFTYGRRSVGKDGGTAEGKEFYCFVLCERKCRARV